MSQYPSRLLLRLKGPKKLLIEASPLLSNDSSISTAPLSVIPRDDQSDFKSEIFVQAWGMKLVHGLLGNLFTDVYEDPIGCQVMQVIGAV